MSTTKTVTSSQTVRVGATTITAHTITALPTTGVHGFHDCTDPGLMSVSNCVWPTDYKNGSGLKSQGNASLANSAVGIAVTQGLTVNMRDGSGSISVTFS